MASQPPPIPPQTNQPPSTPPSAAGALPADAQAEAIELYDGPVITIWQHPFVQDVLPFITSLVLHIGLIVMAYLFVEVSKAVVAEFTEREQIIIPDVEIGDANGPPGGIPHPGLGGDPTRDAKQDRFRDVPPDSKGIAMKPGTALIPDMGGGQGQGEAGSGPMALGPGMIGRGMGVGFGSGDGAGSGTGDGSGILAPFGKPGGGGGIGPKSDFIGSGGSNVRRVAYVCDASGSMLNMFDALRFEIRKSVDKLQPNQSFNVIFFQDPGCAAADKSGLMPAVPEKKRLTYDFLDKFTVRGLTDPIPALDLAFSQKPDLIYLLTDGDFNKQGNEAVVKYCRDKTADGKTKINTIAFVNQTSAKESVLDMEYVKALQQIAKDSGGRFIYVSEEQMGQ